MYNLFEVNLSKCCVPVSQECGHWLWTFFSPTVKSTTFSRHWLRRSTTYSVFLSLDRVERKVSIVETSVLK